MQIFLINFKFNTIRSNLVETIYIQGDEKNIFTPLTSIIIIKIVFFFKTIKASSSFFSRVYRACVYCFSIFWLMLTRIRWKFFT